MGSAIDERWFKAQLAERELSIRQMARKMGLDHSALVLTFKGRRRMQFNEAAQIANLLGVGVSQVLEHAGLQMESPKQAAIVGYVDGEGEAHIRWENKQRTAAATEMPPNTIAVQFRTAMSTLEYLDGWVAFFAPPKNGVSADHVGRLCIVGLKNGATYIGHLRRGYKRGRYNLSGLGNVGMEDAEAAWSCPIIAMRAP